jgi:hypothetical protein
VEGALVVSALLVVAAALLAAPAGPAHSGGKDVPKNDPSLCPWCHGDPALMAAAGIVSHGGFEFGNADTAAADQLLNWLDIVWIESAHFEIGMGLLPYKVRMDERDEIRAELSRLQEVLPDVQPKVKVLDPFMRAHLYAQRAEDEWKAFLELVRLDESVFPDGKTYWDMTGTYYGEGPYLGMKGKYELLFVPTKESSIAFLRENYGIKHEVTQRWHSPARGTLSVTIHLQQGQLRLDRALHGHMAFNLTHNFLDGFKHYSYDTPIGLHEGLAHWRERQVSPEHNTFDSSEGAVAVETRKDDWRAEVLKLSGSDELPSFSSLVRLRTFADLELPDHFGTWSVVDYLITTDPEAFARLLNGIKGLWDMENRRADGSLLPERQRELIKELWGVTYFELDPRWREWIASAYRERKR